MPDEIPAPNPTPSDDSGVATEVIPVRALRWAKITKRALLSNPDEVLALPTPQEGGKLIKRLQCGSCVADIYQHKGAQDFNYTITFAHQVMKDGKPERSTRLSSTDLQAVRVLAAKAGELMIGTEPWQMRITEREDAEQDALDRKGGGRT